MTLSIGRSLTLEPVLAPRAIFGAELPSLAFESMGLGALGDALREGIGQPLTEALGQTPEGFFPESLRSTSLPQAERQTELLLSTAPGTSIATEIQPSTAVSLEGLQQLGPEVPVVQLTRGPIPSVTQQQEEALTVPSRAVDPVEQEIHAAMAKRDEEIATGGLPGALHLLTDGVAERMEQLMAAA